MLLSCLFGFYLLNNGLIWFTILILIEPLLSTGKSSEDKPLVGWLDFWEKLDFENWIRQQLSGFYGATDHRGCLSDFKSILFENQFWIVLK